MLRLYAASRGAPSESGSPKTGKRRLLPRQLSQSLAAFWGRERPEISALEFSPSGQRAQDAQSHAVSGRHSYAQNVASHRTASARLSVTLCLEIAWDIRKLSSRICACKSAPLQTSNIGLPSRLPTPDIRYVCVEGVSGCISLPCVKSGPGRGERATIGALVQRALLITRLQTLQSFQRVGGMDQRPCITVPRTNLNHNAAWWARLWF